MIHSCKKASIGELLNPTVDKEGEDITEPHVLSQAGWANNEEIPSQIDIGKA